MKCVHKSRDWYKKAFSPGRVGRQAHLRDANNGPLARYVKLRVAHAPGMLGTFSPPPLVSDSDMYHGTCATHVPWCMPRSLTRGFLWSRWWGKPSRRLGACVTGDFTFLVRGPWVRDDHMTEWITAWIGRPRWQTTWQPFCGIKLIIHPETSTVHSTRIFMNKWSPEMFDMRTIWTHCD